MRCALVVSATLVDLAPAPTAAVWSIRHVLAPSPLAVAYVLGGIEPLSMVALSATSSLMLMTPWPTVVILVCAAPIVLGPT